VLLQLAESRMLHEALEELPVNFREVIVLRELEGMSYKEICRTHGYAHRHGDVRSGSRALPIAGATAAGA
jgi:DNA-directed RNA polymerase specialized sigma24 family protein